ncbi:MAG: TonB-dependent receptor [Rickettsia endosymbiont of Ixodes persulcatus]|nr:TonB-dependent receptor [Rickettsia endosymbiont of Ixodes persulcatus]
MRIYYGKAISLLLLIVILPSLVQAKTCCYQNKKTALWCVSPQKPLPSWFMDVGLGWVFNQKLGSSYLANIDSAADKYNSPKVNQVPMGFLSGGYVWSRQAEWLPFTSLGLEYSYDMSATVKGVIEEFANPGQANFKYKYKITHHNLHLISKANLYRWQNWMPYVSAGAGIVWNRFSGYSEQAISKLPSLRPNPEFTNRTESNFSYSLGAGIDYVFNENLWGGLGYRYDHFGWGKTGDTNAKFLDKSIKNTLRAHAIIFSLRYLF